MEIKNAEFVISATKKQPFDSKGLDEVAFVGRSNVGKSSLINFLTNRRTLARTSSTPGRTRLINYFSINNNQFYFVDLPGYGYAKGNKQEQKEWKELMESYFMASNNLKLVVLLFDIRRDLNEDDYAILKYFEYYHIPFICVVTKADKLSKSQRKLNALKIARQIGVGDENVFIVSTLDKVGKDEVLSKIEQFVNVNK
ncbi:MAG: ribosome biogenesis GTP-binding protein YihA/YsxC [Christensenellales bacterium]